LSNYPYDEIRKIVVAKTIVESGSMQKAAKELKVTPSAVSQSLSSLERKIGSPLFLREQGRLIPTESCKALLKKAEPALMALNSLFENHKSPLKIDYLDLGTYESLAQSVLPDFIKELRKTHPEVRLNLIVSRTADLLKKLRTGELCIAIVTETDGMDRMRLEEIGRDELGLFVSCDTPDLNDWPAIEAIGFGVITTGTDGIPTYLKKFLKQLGPKMKTTMSSDSYEVLRKAAVNGLTASILPKRVALRTHGDLKEVTQFAGLPKSESGEHKIFLASMERCDEMESLFLSELARGCFLKEMEAILDPSNLKKVN